MAKRRSLTSVVAEALTEEIQNGTLKPGAQIKTELELCEHFEVSRTVIREAIARLRSDGLLIAQQGRGVFVSDQVILPKFEISEDDLSSLPETISLLELRMSVEIESAGLSAERSSVQDIAAIRTLMERVDAEFKDPNTVEIHYDYEFHLAIAYSTGNPVFHRFLKFLEPIIVPRYRLANLVEAEFQNQYYETIHAEHSAIVQAIERRDAKAARANMREHLVASLDRIRELANQKGFLQSGAKGTDGNSQLMDGLVNAVVKPSAVGKATT
ncbi:MAG: GntR family transcriptional repressor for pyruvate dehydrogenase complex [Paracoccaceae bacterium]|jgi:GntR family transcriptional repressor for pyruvate dehydrogenase complex